MNKMSAVLLCGGQSRRMGMDKSKLTYQGQSFRTRIEAELESLGLACFLSVGQDFDGLPSPGWTAVRDELPEAGPMGALYSTLKACPGPGVFAVSCDMPLFRREMALPLLETAGSSSEPEAVLWMTRDGRLQTACAYYSKRLLPALEEHLQSGHRKLSRFLEQRRIRVLQTEEHILPERWFMNINDSRDYARLQALKPAVLAVSGLKNSGKTTALERMIAAFTRRGWRCAVIKHDAHDFQADVPSTDSFRLKEAGAFGTLVYSPQAFSLVKDLGGLQAEHPVRVEDFLPFFPEADLILLEGQKHSAYPKIEVLRQGVSEIPVCDPQTVIAYIRSDAAGMLAPLNGKPVFGRADVPALLRLAVEQLRRQEPPELE